MLNLQQSQKLMSLIEEYSVFNTIIKLLLLTGMRLEECLGLRWNSINFENKTIFIDKTLSHAENEWFLSVPKTERSTRTIAIDDKAIEILKKRKEEQEKQKEIVGAAWQHPELVFTDIRMPVLSGIDLISRAKLISQRTKFVIFSAYNDFEYIHKALRLNVFDYVDKPVTVEKLQEILRKDLGIPKEQQAWTWNQESSSAAS